MKVELRQKTERVITCETIKGLLTDDSKTSILDGEQTTFRYSIDTATIEATVSIADEDQLRIEHQYIIEKGWVLFIYDSGDHDVTADHTANLELLLRGTSKLADKITDEDPAALVRVLAGVGM